MMTEQGDVSLLNDPLAQQLLQPRRQTPASAYNANASSPRTPA